MKKALIFTLLIVYTTLASGVNVQFHYCRGKLKSIAFFTTEEQKSCCGNKMKSKDCCKNKHSFLKVKDSHHLNATIKVYANKFVSTDFIAPTSTILFYKHFFIQSELISDSQAPPVITDNPLFLKNRALII